MLPTPKHLILNLLLAADDRRLTSRQAVGACALFGVSENSVRVTLVRLVSAGLVTLSGRGRYELGPQAQTLADELSQWRTRPSQTCAWLGDWLTVSTGTLGRSDRVALRARDRALALAGFRPLDDALFVRPDNLVGGVGAVRSRLHRLGLPLQAPVFVASQFDALRQAQAPALWAADALDAGYRRTRSDIDHWLSGRHSLSLDEAARQSFLRGNEAIRAVVFDPLLPVPLVDVSARQDAFCAVAELDQVGHAIWRELLTQLADGRQHAGALRERADAALAGTPTFLETAP